MCRHFKRILSLQNNFKILLVLVFLSFIPVTIYADVCVWRNPERTMTKIFPEAGDYKTITKMISKEKKEVIEKRLGESLAPGESKDYIYYEITDRKGKTFGYISADAEKGEYGVIEMVMGITPSGKVVGIYIQRSREKDKEFRSDEFLRQFIGKIVKDSIQIGKDIKAASNSIPVKGVILGVRKMLIFYDELGK